MHPNGAVTRRGCIVGVNNMPQDDRGSASELDLSRMITRPHAPSFAIWWPLVGLCLLAVITVFSLSLFGMTTPTVTLKDPSKAPNPSPQVSRAATSLLEVPELTHLQRDLPVSHLLRQPVRLTDYSAETHDLPQTTARALVRFDHHPTADDVLHQLLVKTLAEGQSDAYIDAALNAALSRAEFAAPIALTTPFGELDTMRLLAAVLQEVSR